MPGSLTFSTNYYTRARTQSLSRAHFSPLHVVRALLSFARGECYRDMNE